MHLSSTLLSLLPFILPITAQVSGSGKTTRFWDCCKSSCSWPGKALLAAGSSPVTSCDANDKPISNSNAGSGCGGGSAYMCSSQTPWAVSDDLAYGFAAVSIAGGTEASWCCACYALTFTSGPVAGKTMIVQATNTGGDLGSNHFDLAIPGGGFGLFDGCTAEWGMPSSSWGARYGGVSSRSQCDAFPTPLRPGCNFRYDWFQNADNPAITFKQVACPAALTAKSGCVRADDRPTGPAVVPAVVPAKVAPVKPSVAPPKVVPSKVAAPQIKQNPTKLPTKALTTFVTKPSPTAATQGCVTAPKWGQCAGIGWAGPKVCVAGTTCKYSNPWYSQCL